MILENIKKYNILLASKSPRRQQMLKELGIDFKIVTKDGIDESFSNELSETEIPVFLAKHKASAFKNIIKKDDILITADTIVWHNKKVLGKPKNFEDAKNIISSLSGDKHQVITGVCLTSLQKQTCFYSVTDVYFKKLSEAEIEYYIKNYKPYDKAGAYGIQEWIGFVGIEKISGSYFNVVGLPIQQLYCELQKFI